MSWSNKQILKVVKGISTSTSNTEPLRLVVLSRSSVPNLKIHKIKNKNVQKALKGDQDTGTSQADFQRERWSREMGTIYAVLNQIIFLFGRETGVAGWKNKGKTAPSGLNKSTELQRQKWMMRPLSQNEGLTFWRKRKSQRSEFGISTSCTFPLLAFKNTELQKVAISQAKWKPIAQ